MKAMVYERYGSPDVLELREVDKPTIAATDVLVRVHAAAVGAGDCHLLNGAMWAVRLYQGVFKPKRTILGYDVAGTVETVGAKVTQFQPGDQVFGEATRAGAFAEYVSVPEKAIVLKPAGLSFEEAAAVPVSALTALQGLRDKGRIQPGHKVLINGASGGVGTFAVQIAKSFGAEVTGVCSTSKLDMVRSIGADHVIDYGQEDFTKGDRRYDLVLDNVGNGPLADCKRTLSPEGIYVAVSGAPTRSLRVAIAGGRRMVAFIAQPNQADLEYLKELLETGKLTPVIDRRYPLSELPEAMRHVGAGHARGKVVITV